MLAFFLIGENYRSSRHSDTLKISSKQTKLHKSSCIYYRLFQSFLGFKNFWRGRSYNPSNSDGFDFLNFSISSCDIFYFLYKLKPQIYFTFKFLQYFFQYSSRFSFLSSERKYFIRKKVLLSTVLVSIRSLFFTFIQ